MIQIIIEVVIFIATGSFAVYSAVLLHRSKNRLSSILEGVLDEYHFENRSVLLESINNGSGGFRVILKENGEVKQVSTFFNYEMSSFLSYN